MAPVGLQARKLFHHAVMFQIVCALALEVPVVLRDIESLHGDGFLGGI